MNPLVLVFLAFLSSCGSTESSHQQTPVISLSTVAVTDGPTPAIERSSIPRAHVNSAAVDLTNHYRDFASDGVIKMVYGMGYDMYAPGKDAKLSRLLYQRLVAAGLDLTDFWFDSMEKVIRFRIGELDHEIAIVHSREIWADSWSHAEVVMYHGHSRFGIGPAFASYQDYFRLGRRFRFVEVDSLNNPYPDENPYNTRAYPLRSEQVRGSLVQYQYRGAKMNESKLAEDSYTLQYPSLGKDLREIGLKQGRQLFWLYSCKNYQYWRDDLRAVLGSVVEKPIVGTVDDSFWSLEPVMDFIVQIAAQTRDTRQIVQILNQTEDCDRCFTAY